MIQGGPRTVGETLALVGAAVLAFTSVLPYWATIEPQPSALVLIDGPTRFPVWRAYPAVVLVGIGLSCVILAVGLAQLVSGRSFVEPRYLYGIGGAIVFVLLLYGLWEGPQRLVEDAFFGSALEHGRPLSFTFERGPLLYVGIGAAAMIAIAGVLADRTSRSRRSRDDETE